MRKSEITLQLPPAELRTNGDIYCREYPLVLYGSIDAPIVYVDNIDISPGTGVVEILMTGEGVEERRHSIGVGASRLPQAAATEMKPLEMRIMNLNPDSSVHVVISTTAVERLPIGTPESFGGAVRFRGSEPLGTDGKREANYLNRDNDDIVIADGPLWKAYLTRNSAVSVRSIRDITSQIRVLSASGTGAIGVSGGTKRMIIVKKDGVTLEVEAESLDFRNIFDIELPSSGNVQILGLIADAIATNVIQNGAITNIKLATDSVSTAKIQNAAVTPAKLDRVYSETSHTHDTRYYTEGEVNSLLAGKAAAAHTHDDRYYTEAQVDALVAARAPANHGHDSGGGQYVGDIPAGARSGSSVLHSWTYNPGLKPVRLYTWVTLRADGGAGTTAVGSLHLQQYDGSSWVTLDSASNVQFDQGVDSSISLFGYMGNPGGRQYRVYWIGSSGTMNVTSGSVLQIQFVVTI